VENIEPFAEGTADFFAVTTAYTLKDY